MPTSVMPKGVEHFTDVLDFHRLGCVPTSVMPKGVEHHVLLVVARPDHKGADLCDAERR